jgi:hypothetical protein
MQALTLTEEQAKIVAQAFGPVTVRDAQGNILGHIEPKMTPEMIAELKRRAASPGPRYSGAQVQARLQALQAEWDRIGGLHARVLTTDGCGRSRSHAAQGTGHMTYSVDWTDVARNVLAAIWLNASDRQAITRARAADPQGNSRHVSEGLLAIDVHPLPAQFEVSPGDRVVTVVSVREMP